MRGKNVAPVVAQIVPLFVLTAFAAAVWVGISIARSGIASSDVASAESSVGPAGGADAAPAIDPRATVLASRESLVYLVDADDRFFHAAGHATGGQRRAVSRDSAQCRGFRPCPVCCKGKAVRAVVNRN